MCWTGAMRRTSPSPLVMGPGSPAPGRDVNLLTRVEIKRTKRLHPEWSDGAILEHIRTLTDHAGLYRDTVTLQDVKDAIASMPEYKPGRLI